MARPGLRGILSAQCDALLERPPRLAPSRPTFASSPEVVECERQAKLDPSRRAHDDVAEQLDGSGVVPAKLDTSESHERATLKLLLAGATGAHLRLPRTAVSPSRNRRGSRTPAEHMQRPTRSTAVAELSRRGRVPVCKAVRDPRSLAGSRAWRQRSHARARRVREARERAQPPAFSPLPKFAGLLPERRQVFRASSSATRVDLQRMVQRESEVLALLLEPVEIVVSEQRLVDGPRENGGVVIEMTTLQVIGFPAAPSCSAANSRMVSSIQKRGPARSSRRRSRLLSSSDCSTSASAPATCSASRKLQAADEHAHPPKQRLLVGVEQVVAPGDRRAQRLLPCIHSTSCLEQVEPLGETVEQLRRAEDDRRAPPRAPVPGAGCPAARTAPQLLRRLQLHPDSRCPTPEQRLAVGPAHRRNRVHVLAGSCSRSSSSRPWSPSGTPPRRRPRGRRRPA